MPDKAESTRTGMLDRFSIDRQWPFRIKILVHVIGTGLLFAGSAVAAIVGLVYNPALAYLPWIAFLPAPLITFCDALLWIAFLKFTKTRSNRFWGSVPLIGGLFIIASALWTLTSLAALGVTFSFASSFGVHVFLYLFYTIAWVGRLISFSNLIFHLKEIVVL